jgi:hypothetical protein
MASSKKRLPALLPKAKPKATDGALAPTRLSTVMRVEAPHKHISYSAAANHASYYQVIMSLTNLQTGLTHVQTGLNDLLRAYMQHTSSILAGEVGNLDNLQLPANITANANAAMEAVHGVIQVVDPINKTMDIAPADGKIKKRKREVKKKDPNAPKKPLTAAFLYAVTARPIVRADLESSLAPGAILEKNAVNLEVTKRWNDLPEEEKEVTLHTALSHVFKLTV